MSGERNGDMSSQKQDRSSRQMEAHKASPGKRDETKGKLDQLLGVVEANKIIGKLFKVDDYGHVVGKRTGTIYATIDVNSFRAVPDDNRFFVDKNATYVQYMDNDARFLRLEGSSGEVSFPYRQNNRIDHSIVISNGNIYTYSLFSNYKKIDLHGNKWIPGKSHVLASEHTALIISFDGESIIDVSTGEILPFKTSDAKFVLGNSLGAKNDRVVAYIKRGNKEAVYDFVENKFFSMEDWKKYSTNMTGGY
ncbi:MAG: hypothetical protein U0518_01770 [Candidatus Gracilibacteria bacterium]